MAIRIRRRDFIVALVIAAAARPAASAERPTAPVIGWLSPGSPETDVLRLSAFNQGLNEISRHIGRNVTIEYRWADGQNDRLPALAADLVHRSVNVIAAAGAAAPRGAKTAGVTGPIGCGTGIDPGAVGLACTRGLPSHNS